MTVNTAADKQGPGIDFLFASGAKGSTRSPEVSFTDKTDKGGEDNSFHHRMSLIKFTFKPGDGLIFNGMEPADYTLDGLKHEGTFDTATGTTAVTAAVESPITMQLGGATTSQVIILPQGVTTSLDLTVSFNGLDYTTTLPNPSKPEANQFSAGYAYTYNIVLRRLCLHLQHNAQQQGHHGGRTGDYPVGTRKFERCKHHAVSPTYRCPGASVKPELPIDELWCDGRLRRRRQHETSVLFRTTAASRHSPSKLGSALGLHVL